MTRYRAFVRIPVPPEPPTPEDFVPLFGTSAPNASGWDDRQTAYSPAITRYFFSGGINWSDSFLTHFRANAPAKQALYLSWKTYSQSALDTFLAGAAADSARLYFLTFHHEPEGDSGYSPTDYQTDNGNVRKRWVAAGKPSNVKLASTLQGFTYRTPTRNPADYYIDSVTAGDGEVYKVFDVLCCDQYDSGYKNNTYANFAQQNQDLVAFGISKGLPIGFGEVGSAVGPKRTTDLTKRRAQIVASADWCVANAGTGPGQVWICTYWDVQANGKWTSSDAEYSTYGAISTADYRISLDPVLKAVSPGFLAGQTAYSEADTVTPGLWQDYCTTSRTYHGIS